MKIKIIIIIVIIVNSCNKPLYRLIKENPVPGLSYSSEQDEYNISYNQNSEKRNNNSFTFTNKEGDEIIFNEAVVDQESGQLVGLRHLNEITISAKANNIAERNGIITLGFTITLPSELQNSNCQIVMTPILQRGEETMPFEKIIVSGKEFKKSQERGYKKFEKYIKSIIPDTVNFLEVYAYLPNLAIFLERNLPSSLAIYGTTNDTLKTEFGVTEKLIIEQYLKTWLINRNNRKKRDIDKKFNKYVKTPYYTGAHLDSIICNKDGSFKYHYTQDIYTNENSSRLSLWISSSIRDLNGTQVELKTSDTIIYNVSSMSGLVQEISRYKKKIIERQIQINLDANISFPVGIWDIQPNYKNNKKEIDKINQVFFNIISEDLYDLDSLYISSFSSPEGLYHRNEALSKKRANSIKNYIHSYIQELSNNTISFDVANYHTKCSNNSHTIDNERIVTATLPEDWDKLYFLLLRDSIVENKEALLQSWKIENLDKREKKLKLYRKDYRYIKEFLYPKLRRVSFKINLLRKGMVKDTIHTTEPDTLYSKGLELLKKREYTQALSILNEYKDINTAIAHISLGHDHSALKILEQIPVSAKQTYMMAIIYARKGLEEKAATYFLKSKEIDFKMAYRGGLDPEISYLINKYNLNRDLFE